MKPPERAVFPPSPSRTTICVRRCPDCKDLFLIPGVEITSANGHILGLFLDAPIDFAALGKFPPPAQAIAAIHASGGLAVLGAPVCAAEAGTEEIARLGFDAIETANAPRDAKARCK